LILKTNINLYLEEKRKKKKKKQDESIKEGNPTDLNFIWTNVENFIWTKFLKLQLIKTKVKKIWNDPVCVCVCIYRYYIS
jgi:hypothetical protein